MKKSGNIAEVIIALILLTGFTRVFFFESRFIDYDSVNYALGTISYSIQNTRPHLPGSPLFVGLIMAVNYFTGNVHFAFELVVVSFSVLGALLTFLFLDRLFKREVAVKLSFLLIVNPLVWYYGSVAEIYSFDLFFAALFGLILLSDGKRRSVLVPILLAFGGGFRISSAVFFLPVYFNYLVKDYKAKDLRRFTAIGLLSALLIFVAWFYPLAISVGGVGEYFALYSKDNPMRTLTIWNTLFEFIQFTLFLFVPFTLLLVFSPSKKNLLTNLVNCPVKNIFDWQSLSLWILPALLFFMFYHYSKGYILLLLPPLLIIAGCLFNEVLNNNKLYFGVVALEIIIFLFTPFKEPSVNIYFNSENKGLSKIEIFNERIFSDNLMSYSHIKEKTNRVEEINKIVKIAMLRFPNVHRLFFDPTVESFARIAQYYNREIKIISPNIFHKGEAIEFWNLIVKKIKLKKIPFLIITRRQFAEKYSIPKGVLF